MIVIARGGGSLEDLLPFSDEGLVRAVFACRTPVVSAIGHESDNPILDLVADHRASTPTDAAKRVVPDVADEAARVAQARERLRHGRRGGDPAPAGMAGRAALPAGAGRLRPPASPCGAARSPACRARAERAVTVRLAHESTAVEHTLARVRAMSPKATLERGYAIVVADDGSGRDLGRRGRPGDELAAYLADGQLRVAVTGRRRREPGARRGRSRPPERRQLSYEQARDELIEVVQQLESGGAPLDESLALWERGERLAAICQDWLDGAQAKIDAARQPAGEPNADPGST